MDENNIIIGVGWSEKMPKVPPGWYLWTKIVFYSGEAGASSIADVVYTVSKKGEEINSIRIEAN
jgi:hypothetical protein